MATNLQGIGMLKYNIDVINVVYIIYLHYQSNNNPFFLVLQHVA